MMSPPNTTPKSKHLDICYRPKSYTNIDFIIPPTFLLTRTEWVEYTMADVPAEIWTKIWEYKIIAEKREVAHCRRSAKNATKNCDDQRKTMVLYWNNNIEWQGHWNSHTYLNYDNMSACCSENTSLDIGPIMYTINKIVRHNLPNVQALVKKYWEVQGENTDGACATDVGLTKSYNTMGLTTFIKKLVYRQRGVERTVEHFFNFVMVEIVKELRKGYFTIWRQVPKDEHIACLFDGNHNSDVVTGNTWIKNSWYERKYQKFVITKNEKIKWASDTQEKYSKLYGDQDWEQWSKSPSPNFYKKERSCLAGIDL